MWDICAGNLGMRVSPETTNKRICAIRWSQMVTFWIMTCLTDVFFEFSDWELLHIYVGGRRNRDRMVVGFTTTYAISTDHHWCCEFESRSGRGAQHYVIKVCQWLATGRWFPPGSPISSTNKTYRHYITEILLKVALNTIKQTNKHIYV